MANKFFTTILRRVFAISIILLLILNFAIVLTYIRNNYAAERHQLHVNNVVRVVHVIDAALFNPIKFKYYQKMAATDPTLNITVTDKPEWKIKFNWLKTPWSIYKKLIIKHADPIALSYLLSKGEWVNVEVNSYQRLEQIALWMLIIGLITTLIILLYVWSLQLFTKPLMRLKQAADKLGLNLQATPLPVYGPGIAKEAIAAMNKMQERITALLHERSLTLAALSHDLRTPLTRLRLRFNLLKIKSNAINYLQI